MKPSVRALILMASLLLMFPIKAKATNLEWLGILTGFGGAERETGMPKNFTECCIRSGQPLGKATGFGGVHALGLIPIGPFGVQGSFQYKNASGSQFSTTFGPLWDFTAGKVGFFASYQHRNTFGQGGSSRSGNFWWLEPALDWYLPSMNLSLRYIQPVSGVQRHDTEHTSDFERVSNVVRYEGEHLVLYHNDRARFAATADHSHGGSHPILQ